jgi:hypothetical protein
MSNLLLNGVRGALVADDWRRFELVTVAEDLVAHCHVSLMFCIVCCGQGALTSGDGSFTALFASHVGNDDHVSFLCHSVLSASSL